MADGDLHIARGVIVPRSELQVRFSASGGPGGQHANKAATRVDLVFDVAASTAFSDAQRERVVSRLGPTVRITVDDERSQLRNRTLAEQRLVDRLTDALRVRASRRPTRPSRGSNERRLDAKRRKSQTKSHRRSPGAEH